MCDALAPDANVRHRSLLLKEIDKYVAVHAGHRALQVTEDGVVNDKDGNEVLLSGRSMICALGQRSRSNMVEELRDSIPLRPRHRRRRESLHAITNAVYRGYHAALDI